MNQVIHDVLMRDWQPIGEQSVSEAAHAGTSIIKTNVDKTNGHPVFTVIPCGQGIPDPVAKRAEEQRFFLHAYPMNPKDIKNEFGFDVVTERYLDVYNPAMTLDVLKSWEKHSNSAPSDAFDQHDAKGLPLDHPGKVGQALVIELWIDDDSNETIPFDEARAAQILQALKTQKVGVDPEDNHVQAAAFFEEALKVADAAEPTYVQNLMDHIKLHYNYPMKEMRKKYPYGKVLTMCQGNSKPAPNPLKIPWRDVFVFWDYFPHPQRLFGKGLGTDLIAPQDTLNHRINAITKNINNINNGVILMRQGVINALVKMKDNLTKLTNAIGLTIPVTDVQRDFKRDFGPALGAHHFAEVDNMIRFMEAKSGHEGLGAGRLPPGSPAGITVEQLLGEAQKPINSVIRRYSWGLKQIVENAVKVMIEFMDDDEIFSIVQTSDNDFNQQYRNIQWKELRDTMWKDIRVDIVGQMGSTRTRKFSEALQLSQYGVYNQKMFWMLLMILKNTRLNREMIWSDSLLLLLSNYQALMKN